MPKHQPSQKVPSIASHRSMTSRRSFLCGLGLVATVAGLSACRSPLGQNGNGSSGRVIQHKFGTTEAPAQPKRVVTVGLTEQDYVLALGLTPVAAREWFGERPGALWPWARQAHGAGPLPEVLPASNLNYERIAACETDLILAVNSGVTHQEYDTLSRIAPTVAQPSEYADYGAPWQAITKIIGRALGREERAGQLVTSIETKFEQVRARHPEFGRSTGLLATAIDTTAYAYAEGPAPGFLKQLGFNLPSSVSRLFTGENRKPVKLSPEQLTLLESDVLLMGLYGPGAHRVINGAVYRDLDVTRQGRDLLLPKNSELNGALSFSTVLSLPFALDELVPRLVAMLDGDSDSSPKPVPG